MHLHHQNVNADEDRRHRRQNGNVKSEEARQRRARYIIAAAQKPKDGPTNDGNDPRDLGADLGRKKEAIEAAKKSRELAVVAENDEYVKMNDASIAEWSKK